MSSNRHHFKYEFSHTDEWNNTHVICPVCGFSFIQDGVMKHIIRSAQVGEESHGKWLTSNKIEFKLTKKYEQT